MCIRVWSVEWVRICQCVYQGVECGVGVGYCRIMSKVTLLAMIPVGQDCMCESACVCVCVFGEGGLLVGVGWCLCRNKCILVDVSIYDAVGSSIVLVLQ